MRVEYEDGDVTWEKTDDGAIYALAEQTETDTHGDKSTDVSSNEGKVITEVTLPDDVDMEEIDDSGEEIFAASSAQKLHVVFRHALLEGSSEMVSINALV